MLAILDIIPPLPSLWSALLFLAAFFLYKNGKTAWAMIPGIIGLVMAAGWLMSLIGWATSLILTLGVIALLAFGAYHLLTRKRKNKNTVDSTATTMSGSLPAGSTTTMPDIDAMLRQLEQDEAVKVR